MSCLNDSAMAPQTKIRRLLLLCPKAVQDAFEAPDFWFEDFQDEHYLRLSVHGDKYASVREGGDKSDYIDTLIGPVAPIALTRVGFSATVGDAHLDRLYLVEQLAFDCITTNLKKHKPIKILDFVRPERQDRLSALPGQEFYTIRLGRILSIEEPKGTVGKGRSLYTGGFTIKFKESQKRRLL